MNEVLFLGMPLQIKSHHFHLSPEQEALVCRKIEHLLELDCRLPDESTQVKIDFFYESSHPPHRAYLCRVTFFVPGSTLRAEAAASTLENGLDRVIDKLRKQIERYKDKVHHLHNRGKN